MINNNKSLVISFNSNASLDKIKNLLSKNINGKIRIKLNLRTTKGEIEFTLNNNYYYDVAIKEKLSSIDGIIDVKYF